MASIPEGFELVDAGIPEGFELVSDSSAPIPTTEGVVRAAGQGLTLGFGDEIIGVLNSFLGGVGLPAQGEQEIRQRFTEALESERSKIAQFKEEQPAVAIGSEIAGGLLTGGAGGLKVAGAKVLEQAPKVARAAVAGSVPGAIGGVGVGDVVGDEDKSFLAEAGKGAALGAGVGTALQAGAPLAKKAITSLTETVKPIAGDFIEAGGELASDIAKFQTPKTRAIAEQLKTGEINTDIAHLKLINEGVQNPTARQKLLGADLPRVVKDKAVIGATDQGFDIDFLETVKKVGTPADKKALLKMTNIAKKGRINPVFRDKMRPSFVAGDVLLDKFNQIKAINRAAGKQIGRTTKFLKGKTVPTAQIGDGFLESLDALKIKIVDGKLNFEDALVSGAGRKKAISDIFGRMTRNKNPDALDVHELKIFIDDTISYGKEVRGLGGRAESSLKDLRLSIKDTLNNNFPEYAKANKAYSDTIDILDEVQSLAGKKTDLTSDSASGQLGILARRETSNAQSRGRVKDAFDNLDEVLKTHAGFGGVKRIQGPEGKVDFRLLMKYADELDKVTGSAATTSAAGTVETAIKAATGPKQFITEKVIEASKKVKGISVENAHKSMEQFLKSQPR